MTGEPAHARVPDRIRKGASIAALSLITLFTLQFVAGTQTGATERAEGGTLRLLFWQAPTVVNPHLSIGSKDLTASRIVYEPLG